MSVLYNDNLQLIPGNVAEVWGGVADAGVRVTRAEERGSLSMTPSLRMQRYDSTLPLNSNDQDVAVAWQRNGERGNWRLDADWTRDTTLTSELAVSGLVQALKRRLQRYISPSYSYALSERGTVTADLSYTKVSYNDALFSGLVNYDYGQADLGMSYQWSERATVTATAYGTRFNAPLIGNRIDTLGTRLRLAYRFNERWDGDFAAGGYRTHDRGGAVRGGGLLDMSLTRKDEWGEWRTGVNRSIDPSGTGVLVQRDQLSLGRDQNLNEWWRFSLNSGWTINKDLQALSANRDRHYRSATLVLTRVLNRDWSVNAIYTYARQHYAGSAVAAEQNSVMLGIHYAGTAGAE